MATDSTKVYLQNYFYRYDSITLYKQDDTPVTFRKQQEVVLRGGYAKLVFKDFDEFTDFYYKRNLCLKPVINII